MRKIIAVLLSSLALNANAKIISEKEYAELFKNYHACFILYNLNEQKIVSEYNPDNYCNKRISPDSTFKVALSLMAFDQGIMDQNTHFKWNGKQGDLPDWNQDQTPATWLKYSVVWVSHHISQQLGYSKIKNYLAKFNYGNQDFSGDTGKNNGMTHAWLSSSLKISANEQLNLLKTMLSHELAINPEAIENTKANMYQGKLNNGADYYGKTGSGRNGRNEREKNPSLLRDGWFVGFINNDNTQYVFVSNLTDKKVQASIDPSDGSLKPYGSQVLKPIILEVLNEYFSK